jgi:hypothetical protein
MSHAFEITHSARNGSAVTGTVQVERTGKAYGFTLATDGAVALWCHATRRTVPASHLRDVRHHVATHAAPPVSNVAPVQGQTVRIREERNGAIVRAFIGDRCLASAMMRRLYTNDPLWTLSRSNGETVATHDSMVGIRSKLRQVARAYLAELQAAAVVEPAPSSPEAVQDEASAMVQGAAAWFAKDQAAAAPEAVQDEPEGYADALAYETSRDVGEDMLTYASAETREACVRAALANGWHFEIEAAAGEWPWFTHMAFDEGRCVMRNGGWRLYVETAAEALAEAGCLDGFAMVEPGAAPEAPAMVPQPVQQQQGRDMRTASPGPAPEILDVSELLERIEAVTGPRITWTAPTRLSARVPLEAEQPSPVLLLAGLAGLLATVAAYIIAASL